MKIINKIKTFGYRLRDNKRYKKFKNCSIPYPFYDDKRNTFEWVAYYKDIKQYDIRGSLVDAIGVSTSSGIIYHYRAKFFGRETPDQEPNYHFGVSHCRNFDEVVKELYDYPETFEIPDEFLN